MQSLPVTPTTATSWGPDDYPSPAYYQEVFRPASVDLGLRGMASVPVTPSTATSWGAPDTPSFIPLTQEYARSPDAGERSFPEFMENRSTPAMSFPYYDAWSREPWSHVWPYQAARHPRARLLEYPDFAGLYPPQSEKVIEVQLPASTDYPSFDLYPAVYPYNLLSIYPAVGRVPESHSTSSAKSIEVTLRPSYPTLEIYSAVYPYNLRTIYPPTSVAQLSPNKELLPEYPDFAYLYPSDRNAELVGANKRQPVYVAHDYPTLEIYPAVYPFNLLEIYSPVYQGRFSEVKVSKKGNLPQYPDFASLYPSDLNMERAGMVKSQFVSLQAEGFEYPNVVVYPSMTSQANTRSISANETPMSFPYYDAWTTNPWNQVWPYREEVTVSRAVIVTRDVKTFATKDVKALATKDVKALATKDMTTSKPWNHVWPYQKQTVSPVAAKAPETPKPWKHVWPYQKQTVSPVAAKAPETPKPWNYVWPYQKQTVSSPRTPSLDYPDFAGLYPAHPSIERVDANKSQSVVLPEVGYPVLNIYPSVYPHSVYEIYGWVSVGDDERAQGKEVSMLLPAYQGYPVFNLCMFSFRFIIISLYLQPVRSCSPRLSVVRDLPASYVISGVLFNEGGSYDLASVSGLSSVQSLFVSFRFITFS